MKLNHAQRSHLIAKFSAGVKALIAKQKDPAGQLFEVTMPCKVKVSIDSWQDSIPLINATNPSQQQLQRFLTPAQKRVLQLAVAAKHAYNTRRQRGEALIGEFKEQLLFADGGLDEANALIKTFLAKLDTKEKK